MVDTCARNSAQLLLGLTVGFKRESFGREREWRIICAPRLGSNNSAPNWIDENFGVNVKRFPRSHIPLQIHQPPVLSQPFCIPPVPFINWAWNPNCRDAEAVEKINDALTRNNRIDLTQSS